MIAKPFKMWNTWKRYRLQITALTNYRKVCNNSCFLINDIIESFICSDLFTGLSWLEELNLSSNQLETIPDDVFENLPKLTRIDLSRNLIKVLSDDLISALSQIKSVSLRANNLFNLDHTSLTNISIEFLDLAQNNLVFLKTNQFKSFDKL